MSVNKAMRVRREGLFEGEPTGRLAYSQRPQSTHSFMAVVIARGRMERCGRSARQSAVFFCSASCLARVCWMQPSCGSAVGHRGFFPAWFPRSKEAEQRKESKQGRNKSKHRFLLPVVRLCFASFFTVMLLYKLQMTLHSVVPIAPTRAPAMDFLALPSSPPAPPPN